MAGTAVYGVANSVLVQKDGVVSQTEAGDEIILLICPGCITNEELLAMAEDMMLIPYEAELAGIPLDDEDES